MSFPNRSGGGGGGTGDVTSSQLTAAISAVFNPSDVGFDIIGCFGQSNMQGNPAWDPLIDVGDPGRVYQWANYSADAATYRKIISGVDPLYMPSGIRTGFTGLATWAAKAYLGTIPTNRKVLLIPSAVGSTGLVGSFWEAGSPGGTYYERAIQEANLAIAAVLLMYPNSRYVGTWWAQGEADGLNGTTQAQYAAGLKAVIAGFRSRITGATNSWFVISPMTPEGITAHTGEVVIDLAHTQVAAETNKCVKVATLSGYGASEHWTAPGVRIMGSRLGIATVAAKTASAADVTPPTAISAVVQNASPSTVVLTMSEAMSEAYTPSGATMTLAGHTVNSMVVSGSTISLSLASPFVNAEAARTLAYAQNGTNNLRDIAGNLLANFSGLAITNNVLPVDVTPPTFVSAQVANATPTVIQLTMNEACNPAIIPSTTTMAASLGKSVSSVSISGLIVSVTCNSAYVFGDTITCQYTNPGSGNRLQDAAGNMVASFGPVSVVNNVGAPATVPDAPTIGTATAGDASAVVTFTAPGNNGGAAIIDYTVTATPSGITATGVSSPINVTGLTNGVAQTFTVKARNSVGQSVASAASNSATPVASVSSYTTFNPSDKDAGITLSNGNLTATATAGFKAVRGISGKASGKWYVEYTMTSGTTIAVGMGRSSALLTNFPGSNANSYGYYNSTGGQLYFGNSAVQTTMGAYTVGDVVGMAVDLDNYTIRFYKNGVAVGTLLTIKDSTSVAWVPGTVVYPMVGPNAGAVVANFGSTAFAYTPPVGFTGWTV